MGQRILFSLLFLAAFNLAAQTNVKITSAEISFVFDSKNVDGTFSGFNSESSIDLNDLTNSVFKGSVEVKTINTGNFLRNWALKGGRYFNTGKHPKISFESSAIKENENGFSVEGHLTIKGIRKPVTFDFTINEKTLIGTTTLYTTDFDIKIKKEREDNKVNVKVVMEY